MTSTLGRSSRRLFGSLVGAATLALCLMAFAAPASAFITSPATAVTAESSTLNGVAAGGGEGATYHFEYGTTTSYGINAPAKPQPVTESWQNVSEQIEGLQPGTTYHYRVVSTTQSGTYFGQDVEFTTPIPFEVFDSSTGEPCPPVSVEGNQVSGGCLIEDMDGKLEIVTPGTWYESVYGSYDIRMGPDGQGYAVNQQFAPSYYNQITECSDEGEKVPWPMTQSKMVSPSTIELSVEVCLKNGNNGTSKTEAVPLEAEIGANNLLGVTQVGAGKSGGIWNFDFDNLGDTDEVLIIEL